MEKMDVEAGRMVAVGVRRRARKGRTGGAPAASGKERDEGGRGEGSAARRSGLS